MGAHPAHPRIRAAGEQLQVVTVGARHCKTWRLVDDDAEGAVLQCLCPATLTTRRGDAGSALVADSACVLRGTGGKPGSRAACSSCVFVWRRPRATDGGNKDGSAHH